MSIGMGKSRRVRPVMLMMGTVASVHQGFTLILQSHI